MNLHSDWSGCPNIKWLKKNSYIKNIRIDFPCRESSANAQQLKDVLKHADYFDTIMLHVGYFYRNRLEFSHPFIPYLNNILDEINRLGLNDKVVVELWNNVNLGGYWEEGIWEFTVLLDRLESVFEKAKRLGIRLAGMSFTLNHDSGWEWIRGLYPYLEKLDFVTIQIYQKIAGDYIKLIDKFESEFPDLKYIVAETGVEGRSGPQNFGYRCLMYEIEKRTPDVLVFLYHLFDLERDDSWELISWDTGIPMMALEKETARYLKRGFSLSELKSDLPKGKPCIGKKTGLKWLLCALRRIFSVVF